MRRLIHRHPERGIFSLVGVNSEGQSVARRVRGNDCCSERVAGDRTSRSNGQRQSEVCMYNVWRRQPLDVLLKIMSPILHVSLEFAAISILVVLRIKSSCSCGENTPSLRKRSKTFENSRRSTRRVRSRSNSPRTLSGKLVNSSNFFQSFSKAALRNTDHNSFKSCC